MSTAEITAHRIFESYKFDTLPDEVKHHLAILFTCPSVSEETKSDESELYVLPTLTDHEKTARLREALADAKEGRILSCEEVHRNLEEIKFQLDKSRAGVS